MTEISGFLEDPWELEEFQIRRLTPEGALPPISPYVDKPTPVGLASGVGSIGKAKRLDLPPRQPPTLPAPTKAVDYKQLSKMAATCPDLIPALAGLVIPSSENPIPSVESQKAAANAIAQDLRLDLPQLNTLEDMKHFVAQLKNFQGILANLQIRNDVLASQTVNVFDIETQRDLERLQKLNIQLKEAMLEHMRSVKDEKKWGVLQDVLQYFMAATSIVFGVALVATGVGVAAGAILIAAGGLALINRVMSDTGAWKALVSYFTSSRELQTKIANRIETGMFLLSLALTLTGGVMALQAGNLTDLVTLDRAMKVLTLTTAVANGGVELAKGFITKKSQDMKAKILSISAETTAIQYDMQRNSSTIEETQKLLQETAELVKRAISQLEVSLD